MGPIPNQVYGDPLIHWIFRKRDLHMLFASLIDGTSKSQDW